MARPLGPLQPQLLAYTQMCGMQSVRIGELAGPRRLSDIHEPKLLSQLAAAGLMSDWLASFRMCSRLG